MRMRSIDILYLDATYGEFPCLTVYPRMEPQAATISKDVKHLKT
jgi:hypothetical protein